MKQIPNPNEIYPNEYKTSVFLKNIITAPNISIGDYTYYDDAVDPTGLPCSSFSASTERRYYIKLIY